MVFRFVFGVIYNMKILIELEQLKQLKSRELIPLECEHCKSTFHLEQHYILAFLNGKDKNRGRFCSKHCCGLYNNIKNHTKINCYLCGKEKDIYKSDIKEKNFCSCKCSAIYYNGLRKKPITPKIEKLKRKINYINLNCSFCHIPILRTNSEFRSSKSKTFFCNKTCKTKYANQYQIMHKPKSRAEILLCNLIKENFPNLTIRENVRDILPSKLEIDIFIPEYKLAIELNGPVHYIPIYGQDKLDKIKNKDLLKQSEIRQLGLNLVIVDISRLNSRQSTDLFIREYFDKYISPILNGTE